MDEQEEIVDDELRLDRNEINYKFILNRQLERINQLASSILSAKKKSGKVSKINIINFKYAIKILVAGLPSELYAKDEFKEKKESFKGGDLDKYIEFYGYIIDFINRISPLLKKETEEEL